MGPGKRQRAGTGAGLIAVVLVLGAAALADDPDVDPFAAGGDDPKPARSIDPVEAPATRSAARRRAPRKRKQAAPARQLVVRTSVEGAGYRDTDHVTVATPTIAGGISDPVAGWSFDGRYLLDAVSAASVDIVSSASSRWHELRHVGSAAFKYKPHDVGFGLSGGVSREPDYLSIGAGGTVTLDLLEKNLSPTLGYSFGYDVAGRADTSFSVFSRALTKHTFRAGATVIVNPTTVLDLAADLFVERGNQAKPYRFVPLFGPGESGRVPAGASIDEVNAERVSLRPNDELPRARDRAAFSARFSRRFSGSTLHLQERLYSDSWGLKASTTDARYILDVGRSLFVWPHLRGHVQDGVAFWRRAYEVTVDPQGALGVPRLRTGDRELGPLHTFTAGGGLRLHLGEVWSVTLQGDWVHTTYRDALYITQRTALFGALTLDAELN